MKDFRLIIIGILFCALGSLDSSAQIRDCNFLVTVVPDHQDWNRQVDENANLVLGRKVSEIFTINYYIYF